MFSAGDLENPKSSDKRFASRQDAEIYAIEQSIDDNIWAVWDDKDGEILAIVYQQIAYYP